MLQRAWYAFVAGFWRLILYPILGGVKVTGLENIPMDGPFILAPNHLSNLDPPIAAIHQPRLVHTMSKIELMRIPVLGLFLRSIFVYGVRRGENDTEAIRKTLGFLESGEPVMLFPEGTRGDGVRLGKLSPGIAMMAKKTGVKVVPAAIQGTQLVMPKGKIFGGRHRMQISYGVPLTFDEVAGSLPSAAGRQAFMSELESRILALCHEAGLELKASSDSEATSSEPNLSRSSEATKPSLAENQTPH